MTLPTFDEVQKLHEKHAPNKEAFESVWLHCQIVRDIALQVAEKYHTTDHELITIGALLHDIGVYQLFKNGEYDKSKHYVTHGLRGYELLKAEGFDEALCRFALLHTGVGITKEDIEKMQLPLPARDYLAETDEERIVMYADKFHSKSNHLAQLTFNSVAWYKENLITKFGQNKLNIFENLIKEFGEPDLISLAARYNQPIR